MNREIKFRIWDKNYKKFLQKIIQYLGGVRIVAYTLPESRGCSTFDFILENPKDYEVQQFTNVVDAMGTAVYEGDIVSFRRGQDDFDTFGFVFWSKEYLTYLVQFEMGASDYGSEYLYIVNMKNFHVVGNVFQNKNLIREELVKKYFP